MKIERQTPMRWLMRLLVLLLLVPATSGGSALAQDYTLAGEWEINFDILNGEIRATWIGRVWQNEDGNEANIKTIVLDISDQCVVFGAPIFAEDDVTFDGVDDYITCKIPNLPVAFSPGFPQLRKCECYFNGPPYVSADVSPVYSTDAQPVVYQERLFLEVMHQDAETVRFPMIKTLADGGDGGNGGKGSRGGSGGWLREAMRVDASNSLGVAQLTLRFVEGEVLSWQSNRFGTWQQDGFQIWAGYNAARFAENHFKDGFNTFLDESGFWDAVQTGFVDGFFMWESEAQSLYEAEPMPSGFGLESGTDIYIGHNPVTGTFFEGTMRAVAVDPGCRGH